MNYASISFMNRTNNSFSISKDKEKNSPQFEEGSILSATFMEKFNDISYFETDDGISLSSKSDKVKGNIGDKLYFEVTKCNSKGIELKQVFPKTHKEQAQQKEMSEIEHNKELFKQNNFIEDPEKDRVAEETERLKKIAEIRRKMSYGINNTNDSAVTELIKGGISLEKISFDLLINVMNELEIDSATKVSSENIDLAVEKYFNENNVKTKDKKSIEALLEKSLPINESNINSMQGAVEKFENLKDINDSSIVYLLKNEKDLTLGNIYSAKYSGSEVKLEKLSQEELEGLGSEIDRIFKENDIEATHENKAISKFLIENSIAVTKENIEKTAFLRNFSNEVEIDVFLSDAASCLKDGKNILDIALKNDILVSLEGTKDLEGTYRDIIKELPFITAEKIDYLINNKIPITISNLRNNTTEITSPQGDSTDAITAKRQLAEIHLKLTIEAANRLAGKGINIDTLPLREAVDNLRILEKESYARNLKSIGAVDSPDNLNKMSEVFNTLRELNPLTNNVFRSIITKEINFNLAEMHGTALAERLAEYEMFETVVSFRYGDSFAKVKPQFKSFLEGIGIEATDANIKAAEILSKTKTDVNPETLNEIKLINSKVDYVFDRLHPNIAASIIKEGLNPLEMHIDELIGYIDAFDNVFGEDLRDKIATHIMETDKNKTLTEEERDSMIAIYRTLSRIQKDGSAGLGVAFKNNINLTLGNMLEASKNHSNLRKTSNLKDIKVDEDFGMLQEKIVAENNIREVFSKTIDKTKSKTYNDFIIESFAEKATPDNLQKAIGKPGTTSIESLLEEFNSPDNISKVKIAEGIAKLNEIFSTDVKVINWLQNNNLNTSAPTLNAMSNLLADPFFIGRAIGRLNEKFEDEFKDEILDTDLSALTEKSPEEILSSVAAKLETVLNEQESSEAIKQIKLVQNAVLVQNAIQSRKGNNDYKLPIKLHDKVANLNMYILNNAISKEDDSTMIMSLNTTTLGNVQAFIETSGDYVNIKLSSNSSRGIEDLKADLEQLSSFLEEEGFHVGNIVFEETGVKNMIEKDIKPTLNLAEYGHFYEV